MNTDADVQPTEVTESTDASAGKLEKKLGLLDVFAISTGAMFSSGFFLLPGVAAGQTGPSVVLAYLIASFLMLPAMLSMAELTTAMPRAGGAYYFLDRALGPLAGTIGGIGTWLALVLKSSFALIGMGAYLAIFFELPIQPLAVALTVAFCFLNIFGAKETAGLQRALVVTLIAIMTFYVVQGIFELFSIGLVTVRDTQFSPFLPFGVSGLFATVGLVFVSYAGLTKVASVAEEVRNPDRNIPLGMILSLGVTTAVYVLGVFIMVGILPPDELRADLTPVATAGDAFLDWLPQSYGLVLVVVAAIAAFASTGNAGILAASRYPLAMARDHLVPRRFSHLGRFKTPTFSIVVTSTLMIASILLLNVEQVAKLASAFQLLIFALLNLAVIVMRESRITTYVPGFISPLYPWMQIFGVVTSLLLIMQIGLTSALFTAALIAFCIGWYVWYARPRTEREGAIYHIFSRLGRRRFSGLDSELREIMKERTLQEHDPYEAVIAQAHVLDLQEQVSYEEVVQRVAAIFSERTPYTKEQLEEMFLSGIHIGDTPVSHGAALPHLRLPNVEKVELVLVRVGYSFKIRLPEELPGEFLSDKPVCALLFLVGPQDQAGQHLRILAELLSRVDEESFLDDWNQATDSQGLRETFLRHERFISLMLRSGTPTAPLVDQTIRDIHPQLPESSLVALIRRGGEAIIPHGSTVLRENDRLTIIGSTEDISELYDQYT